MYLKSLEIHGFKSFADKTKLEFEPGITCIVGPNGSGKSNICDALRWVLGEQSLKTLRGSKLEDIIFNGSENRRPLGMASVSLNFDNTSGLLPLEFNEVTVGRRVYRSGESEFLINKASCRLKDIQELFHDTGVGKEAFAIIGQGQVDAVLSSRPEERRSLFDEAAGIVRYRNRKTEATKKLDATQVNLDRIQDLLHELGQNLGTLKEEAKKTKQYGILTEELENLELSLYCQDLSKTENQQQNILKKEEEIEKILLEKESKYTLLNAQWEENQFAKEKIEEKEKETQQEIFYLQGEIHKTDSEIKFLKERVDTIMERKKTISEEERINLSKIKELEEGYGEEEKELNNLISLNNPLEEKVRKEETELESYQNYVEGLVEEEKQLRAFLFDVEQELVSLRNKQMELQFELKNLIQQKIDLEKLKNNHIAQKEQLTEELAKAKKGYINSKNLVENALKELAAAQETKKTLTEQLGKLEAEREEVQKNRYATQSKLNVLKEMKENLEGYQYGVASLIKNTKNTGTTKILGAVAEMLKVPSQYEKAIETALGGALQFLVVENEEEAKKAIEWLKNKKAGRATFLPLTSLQIRKLPKSLMPLLGQTGVLGLASGLVEIEAGKEKVLDYLLGSIIVVTDLTVGTNLARLSKFSVKIVTLDGDVIFPGGSLTGGSSKKNFANILGRTREIEEEKKRLEFYKKQEEMLQIKIGERNEKIKNADIEQEKIKNEIQTIELQFNNNEQLVERLGQEMAKENNLLEYHLLEIKQLFTREDELKEEIAGIENLYVTVETNKNRLAGKMDGCKKQKEEIDSKIKGVESQLLQEKILLASQKEKQKSLESFLAYYQQNKKDLQKTLGRLQEEFEKLKERSLSAAEELTTLGRKRSNLFEMEGRVAKTKRQIEAEKNALLLEVQTRGAELKKLAKELELQKNEFHQLEMQKTRLEVETSKGIERLWEKFQLTWDEAREKAAVPLASRREAVERVAELKKAVDNLGAINPLAIGEFSRQEDRYQFLTLQQQDLLKAKEGLYQIIAEMDKIMKQRFMETFRQVESAFPKVFAYLFEGGKASLGLTNEEEILESGIEIIAQPPGKSMQNLNLLSGGERALTAIALLFALLKVKPSPFCVLDEIDANLDEVNVERFARYLKEFESSTQFILISHRQGTMEVANALYGVTMEELGVSRLISVKMISNREVS